MQNGDPAPTATLYRPKHYALIALIFRSHAYSQGDLFNKLLSSLSVGSLRMGLWNLLHSSE